MNDLESGPSRSSPRTPDVQTYANMVTKLPYLVGRDPHEEDLPEPGPAARADGPQGRSRAHADHDHSGVPMTDTSGPRNPITHRQALFNAATILARVAHRENRHPATRAVLLFVAQDLRREAMALLSDKALNTAWWSAQTREQAIARLREKFKLEGFEGFEVEPSPGDTGQAQFVAELLGIPVRVAGHACTGLQRCPHHSHGPADSAPARAARESGGA